MDEIKKYPIKVVSKRIGLSLHVIRAWEKRYNVVVPQRTETNRRLYSEADIHRLSLLKQATESGYNIGNIADLPTAELEQLAEVKNSNQISDKQDFFSGQTDDPKEHYDASMRAIASFDPNKLEAALSQASVSLTQPVLLDSVIIPLVEQIGERWRDGDLRIMHEHMASAVLKTFLSNLRNAYRNNGNTPAIIVTTPIGQLHEIGALIIALVAAAEGWQVVYLGTNMPAEEIVAASNEKNAKAVVLSIVYPADDPFLYQELEKLRNLLPNDIKIISGGRVVNNYQKILTKIEAWSSNSLTQFRTYLRKLEIS